MEHGVRPARQAAGELVDNERPESNPSSAPVLLMCGLRALQKRHQQMLG